uniref:Uncharacterized protein n=1 Tax=Panagrolaimus sp. ES5 TaxID=591445 RepID=A0AC34FVB9_9BILA
MGYCILQGTNKHIFIESLSDLVRQHQQTEKKRKKQERDSAIEDNDEITVIFRNCVTGIVLKPEETPKQDALEAWMEIQSERKNF